MTPVVADAAATAGLARYTSESVCPIRPTKLRLRALATARSPAASTPIWPPRHGPHVGVLTTAPASMKTSVSPSRMHCRYTSCVAGMTMAAHAVGHVATAHDACRHAHVFDTTVRAASDNALLDGGAGQFRDGLGVFGADEGAATVGGTSRRSMRIVRSYEASSSAVNSRGACRTRSFM